MSGTLTPGVAFYRKIQIKLFKYKYDFATLKCFSGYEGIPRTPNAYDRPFRGCLPGYASLVA
jgi:hypothetical protein